MTIVTWGTVAWGLALVACLIFWSRLRADGHAWWLPTCLAGVLLGLLGISYCRRRRQALAGRSDQPEA